MNEIVTAFREAYLDQETAAVVNRLVDAIPADDLPKVVERAVVPLGNNTRFRPFHAFYLRTAGQNPERTLGKARLFQDLAKWYGQPRGVDSTFLAALSESRDAILEKLAAGKFMDIYTEHFVVEGESREPIVVNRLFYYTVLMHYLMPDSVALYEPKTIRFLGLDRTDLMNGFQLYLAGLGRYITTQKETVAALRAAIKADRVDSYLKSDRLTDLRLVELVLQGVRR